MNTLLIILGILYVVMGLVYGLSGVFAFWILGKSHELIPVGTSPEKRYEIIELAEQARKDMLPWIFVAFVAWPINFLRAYLIRRRQK